MATRRRYPDHAGHDAPELAIITPTTARASIFAFLAPPSSLATPAAAALLTAIAVASHRLA